MTRINVIPVSELSDQHLIAETFVPIEDFEKYYAISNFGRVYSMPRTSWNGCGYKQEGDKFLKLKDNGNGYKYVWLHKNNKATQKYIHRLVAEHFLDNPNKHKQINHKNGKKNDNRLQNLEWCSVSQNILHRYNVLEKNKRRIMCVETGEIFSTCKEADIKLGVASGSVSKIIRNLRKKVKGVSFVRI